MTWGIPGACPTGLAVECGNSCGLLGDIPDVGRDDAGIDVPFVEAGGTCAASSGVCLEVIIRKHTGELGTMFLFVGIMPLSEPGPTRTIARNIAIPLMLGSLNHSRNVAWLDSAEVSFLESSPQLGHSHGTTAPRNACVRRAEGSML